ncbi:XTP/dITP diphosphatase [Weissella halotolerans]|uniref:dITP/XTP pyrophosphatase n=1 Tax=Weissella halotolerans DSM 20190 TaxID=1123500 RepID=A0A0R2GAB4_9LACO|nr:XTP/dITP diphosphatase [Weissella halotolerans]KRN33661.1 RdgB HAM1 family non-canonical purine NTP pyrophosphatase [Weissella halotolerans DSM 20190]
MQEILFASRNEGKIKEFQRFLAPFGIKVRALPELKDVPSIQEDGATFLENARIKAQTIMDYYHLPVVAEDGGLMVKALAGAPGVHSARYAGDHDDVANNAKLLSALSGLPTSERTAAFYAVIVALKPNGDELIADGQVDGRILTQPQGEDGFGYDPLFFYPPFDKTMAEMTLDEKNAISHRGRALTNFMQQLPTWLED